MPTWFSDCSCDLLMNIPNASRIGNCRRRKVKDSSDDEEVDMIIRGINADLFRWSPDKILASMTLSLNPVTISLVPLHNPSGGSRLRSKIIGQPIFIVIECDGNPGGLMEFKYSIGILSFLDPDSSMAASTLRKIFDSPDSRCRQLLLTSSTSAFNEARIARSLK